MSESQPPSKKEPASTNKLDLIETEILTVGTENAARDQRLHDLTCKALRHGVSLPVQFAVRETKQNSFVAIGVRPSLASSDERLIVDSEELILAEEIPE